MTINEVQDEIIEEFSVFEDWMDKYSYIIDLGNDLPELDEKYKTEENLIDGCQSKVYVHPKMKDGRIIFKADSDAIITKGIIALLIRVYSKRTPDEILDSELYFIDKIGLKQHLSPTRSNGLVAMIKKLNLYAMAYKAKQNK